MSTPFPLNSKRKGLSMYAPRRLRDVSQDSAELADTSAQTEAAQSEEEQTGVDQAAVANDTIPANEDGPAKDPLDWIDDAIRAVVDLKHAADRQLESDPSFSATRSPPITPAHDESDDPPASRAQPRNRTAFRDVRPRPPRLETEIVPPPPPPPRERGRPGQILRMSLVIAFAAIVAYGLTWLYPSRPGAPPPNASSDRVAEATPPQAETQAAPQMPARLIVEDEQVFANDPVALAINVEHATGSESLLLDGLAQGTTLSAGTSLSPSSWLLAPDKLAGLYLHAPKDFVGVMSTTVKLLDSGKRLLDSRAMQLKWVSRPQQQAPQAAVASAGKEPPTGVRIDSSVRIDSAPPPVPAVKPAVPAVQPIDPSEAAMLTQRGRDFLAAGDISAARVAFRRLADAGEADAALALANTYDPGYLAAHHVVGGLGDRAMARKLYQRARELGSAEAGQILARMGAN